MKLLGTIYTVRWDTWIVVATIRIPMYLLAPRSMHPFSIEVGVGVGPPKALIWVKAPPPQYW